MRLQKAPEILTGWLNLKTSGMQPTEFGDALVPVLEVGDLYGHPDRTGVTAAAATGAVGSIAASIQPTATESWRVKALAMVLARNVADIALTPRVNIVLRRSSGAALVILSNVFNAVPAPDLTQSFGIVLPRVIYLSGQDRLSVSVQTTLSVAGTVGLTADIDRLPL